MPVYVVKSAKNIPSGCKIIKVEGNEFTIRCPRGTEVDGVRIHDLRSGERVTRRSPAKW